MSDYSFIVFYNEAKKKINEFGPNPVISDFPIILLNYNDFLNSVKINSSIVKLTHLYSYIKDDNSNIFLNKFLHLAIYIIKKYLAIDEDIRINNIDINNHLISNIYKTIFILYEYYYYIKNLHTDNIHTYLNELSRTIINTSFATKEEKIYDNIVKNFNKEVLKYNTGQSLNYDKYYFSSDIIEFKLPEIIQLNEALIIDDQNETKIYIKSIYILIIDIQTKLKISIEKSLLNSYITIPQYLGNCWYISILTAMCYSDASKDLILKDLEIYEPSLTKSQQNFKDFIKYLIEGITRNNRKYSTTITSDCDYFKRFKHNQYTFLADSYNDFYKKNKSLLSTISFNSFVSRIGYTDDYYLYIVYFYKKSQINKNINTINEKIEKINRAIANLDSFLIKDISISDRNEANEEIIKLKKITQDEEMKIEELNKSLSILNDSDKIGNSFIGYLFIRYLYNILNISSLYLFNDIKNSTNYYKQADIRNPDIIFIHFFDSSSSSFNEYTQEYFLSLPNISILEKKKIKIASNIITYNDIKYKLDYLLHMTDDKASCKNCGHCITGIHYKGEQYYYNSSYIQKEIKCDEDDKIRIPCSLIKQEWKPSRGNTKSHFCLKKCFYEDVQYNYDFEIEKDFSKDNVCFNLETNFIYAYVKIT